MCLKDNNKFILLNIIIISIFYPFYLEVTDQMIQAYTFAYNFLINSDQSFLIF